MLDEGLKALVAHYGVGETRSRGVLLVDDDQPNLIVLASFLESGYTLHTAESGPQALEIAKRVDLDVVITDQRMPEMTGVELLEQLRDIKPDVAGIVLTGFTDPPALISAINRARVFRFLRKPWQSDEILEAVRQASESVYQNRAIKRLVDLLARRTEELLVSLDLVEQQHQQVLHLERLGTMGRLSAGIAHDLRNVMVSLGYIETELDVHKASKELKETVHVGMQGVTSLIETLEAMHQFARNKGVHVELKDVVPAKVIQDAVAITRMDPNYRLRRVQVQVEPDLPLVRGDSQKLTQVMVNLVRNAVQATREWGVVEIKAARVGPDVVFAVEDEGEGVPQALKQKLFQAFVSSKSNSSANAEDGGMGLGLYMAKMIIDSHHGLIACVDRPQGGARFEVRLSALQPAQRSVADAC